jgi:beta-N-acetylhexosaminidase
VAKHAPGHGRALADSHVAVPHVDGLDPADTLPFATNLFIPWWMTAHVVYDGIDTAPATLSHTIVTGLLRGQLGYGGVIVSDDLAMGALSGTPAERARAAWAAGCDLALYCPGDAAGTRAVLEEAPPLSAAAERRLHEARVLAERSWAALDRAGLMAERDALAAQAA